MGTRNGQWLENMTAAYKAPDIVYDNAGGNNAGDRLTF